MPKRSRALLLLLLPSLLLASVLFSHAKQEAGSCRTLRYKITSKGFAVGEMKTVLSPAKQEGGRAIRYESELSVEANLLFFKVSTRSRENAVIDERGTVSYSHHGVDNGSSVEVDAACEGGTFRFKTNRNGVAGSVEVPRSGYDFTTMDLPETTMQRVGDTMEVRLLDLERARVVRRKFHWLRNEVVEVGGRRLNCRVVDFTDRSNDCRRWVSKEGGVVIVRQEGKGKGGSYTIKLVSLQENGG